MRDHALYYCDVCHSQEFDNWRNASCWVKPGSCSPESQYTRVATADLTPPELEESPFRVVRAIARGLQPIWYGHGFERPFTERLRALLNGREPNLAPHPIC